MIVLMLTQGTAQTPIWIMFGAGMSFFEAGRGTVITGISGGKDDEWIVNESPEVIAEMLRRADLLRDIAGQIYSLAETVAGTARR